MWYLIVSIPYLCTPTNYARSVCRTPLSVVELIARNKTVSSSKTLTLGLTCRSFMYASKRTGLITEPCVTPKETEILSELAPIITTACFRLSKKSFIYLIISPP